jgi:hypothetical protein
VGVNDPSLVKQILDSYFYCSNKYQHINHHSCPACQVVYAILSNITKAIIKESEQEAARRPYHHQHGHDFNQNGRYGPDLHFKHYKGQPREEHYQGGPEGQHKARAHTLVKIRKLGFW